MIEFRRKPGDKKRGSGFIFGLTFFLFWLSSMALSQTAVRVSVQTLSNGLQLIIDQNPYSQTTAVFILIKGGKLADPQGKAGLGYLVARLSLDPPDTDFLKELMKSGAEIRVASRGDFLLVSLECLSSQFDSTMKLIYRTFSRPIFSGLRLNNLKEALKNYQKKELDDIDSRADLALLEAFFGSSPYGLSGYGHQLSIENLKSEDASSYHRKYFVGANIIMSVVSSLEPDAIKTVVESTFGRLPKGESFSTEFPSWKLPEKKEIKIKKETPSSLLAAAFPLPSLSARSYVLANFLDAIVGGGPGSKIWPLRSEEGLAYEVGSRLILMKGGSLFIIYLKTLAEKTAEARARFQEKLKEIENSGLNEDDLEMGRNCFRLWLYQQFEAKIKKAELQANFRALEIDYDLAEDSLEAFINKIKLPDLSEFFKEVFSLEKSVFLEIIPSGNDLTVERNQPGLLFWPGPDKQAEYLQIPDRWTCFHL